MKLPFKIRSNEMKNFNFCINLKTHKFVLKYKNFDLSFYPESLLGKTPESKKIVVWGEALVDRNNMKTSVDD